MEEYSIFPLFYFPPVSWFQQWFRIEGEKRLEKFENFQKQTYRNRTVIYGANGPLPLIIPISHGGGRLYQTTKISSAEDWRKLHFKSIKNAYQAAPYFEYYEDRISKFYEYDSENLFDFNLHALQVVFDILKADAPELFTESYHQHVSGEDFRTAFDAKRRKRETSQEVYYQLFADKLGFEADLSIIDLVCNLGPEAKQYLIK